MYKKLILLFIIPMLWAAPACNRLGNPEPKETPGDSTHVRISFPSSGTIFPEHWRKTPINAEFKQLEHSEEPRSNACMKKAMRKYPAAVLQKNLRNVYVLKSIDFYDVGFGATYYEKNLYIANNGVSEGYTDKFIEQSFHHEFSSILFFAYADEFDKTAWMLCNPGGFEYFDEATGGVQSLKDNKDGTYFSSVLNNQGFLDQYSQSSMENDVNQLAQQLFCPDPTFWGMVDKYPQLKCKVRKLVGFYNKIDKAFTMEYFKKFDTVN